MKRINEKLFKEMAESANASSRKRVHFCLHKNHDDPVQRLCVVMEPGTYIRPHRHANPEKWEFFVILKGRAHVILFDDNGTVTARQPLDPNGGSCGLEIPASEWHTLVVEKNDTLLVEVKPGPFVEPSENDFALWAPAEDEAGSEKCLWWLQQARVGDTAPDFFEDDE
jgi:cupin fold WbuC family metalloprotein